MAEASLAPGISGKGRAVVAVAALLGVGGYFTERLGIADLPGERMDYTVAGATVVAIVILVTKLRARAPHG